MAASILTAAYHLLKGGVPYADLGVDHFDRRNKAQFANRLIRRLHDLGLPSRSVGPHSTPPG